MTEHFILIARNSTIHGGKISDAFKDNEEIAVTY
jgi:hypothetical protein